MYEEKQIKIIDYKNFFNNSSICKIFDGKYFYEGGWCEEPGALLFYDEKGGVTREGAGGSACGIGDAIYTIGQGMPYTGYIYSLTDPYNYDEEFKFYGRLWTYVYYSVGSPIGPKVYFYDNGNIKQITNCLPSGSILNCYYGPHFEWYEDGTLKEEGYYLERMDGLVLYRKYDENGKLVSAKTELTKEEIAQRDFIANLYSCGIMDANSDIFKRYIREDNERPEDYKHAMDIFEKIEIPLKNYINNAIANGVDVRTHVPDFMPENMNPLNAVREPIIFPEYEKKYK